MTMACFDSSGQIDDVSGPCRVIFPIMPEKFVALRILVVDDEFLIRWSVSQTLAEAGHTVVQAGDGASAIQALTNGREPIDAILLDYRLPDSDDFSLLAKIRELAPASPVVLMTAHGSPEIRRGALELGAEAVVGKPFDVHAVHELLLRVCGSRPA